jgi:hypothetical protein
MVDAWARLGLLLAFGSPLACGPPSVSVSNSDESEGNTTSMPSDLGMPEDLGGPTDFGTHQPQPDPCEVIERDPSLPVMTDLEIRCPNDEWFVHAGACVATGSDRSWVFPATNTLEGFWHHYMFELVGGVAELIDTDPYSPMRSCGFAVDAEGVLHMLRHEEVVIETPSVVTSLRWEPPTFSAEPVPNSLWVAYGLAFEFDDAGGQHVVLSNYGFEHEHVHRPSGGMWTTELVESNTTLSFGLTTQNQLFHYDSRYEQPEMASHEINVVVAGVEQTIATGLDEPLYFYAIRKPMPGGAIELGPEYAGVAQTDAGLRFAAHDQLLPTIPATARVDIDCPTSHSPPCGQICEVAGVGLKGEKWKSVRTADGRTWLIWIENALDLRYEYVASDSDECVPTLVHDASIATLHVDVIDFDAPELLVPGWSMVVRRSDRVGVNWWVFADSHLAASAWGEVITIAVVEGGTELDPDRSLRVLELDAELLP